MQFPVTLHVKMCH